MEKNNITAAEGIVTDRYTDYSILEEQDEVVWEHSPQFEFHDFKEYNPNKSKYLNFDVEFLAKDDDSYLELTDQGVPEAPLDDFDGNLPKDQVSDQDYRVEDRYKPISQRDILDYSEMYDDMEMNRLAKVAAIKTARIIPGDMILIMRPEKYLDMYSTRDRVARVLDSMENGWLIVQNLRGEKIAVFAGNTDEDEDIQKLNFDFLEQMYKNKIAKKKDKKQIRIELIRQKAINQTEPDYYGPDEDKQTWLEEEYWDEP